MNGNFDDGMDVTEEETIQAERRGRRLAWESMLPDGTLDISPSNMFQYIESWKQGNQQVVALGADGFFHLASALHLSITECVVREDSENERWIGDATARNEITGQTVYGHSEEAYRTTQGRANHGARAKASTKAQRNALKKLVPRALITEIIAAYKGAQGRPVVSPLEAAKNSARTAVKNTKSTIESMGLTMDEVYEAFQEEKTLDEWDASDYRRFANALRNANTGRIRELADAKAELPPAVAPDDAHGDDDENGEKPF